MQTDHALVVPAQTLKVLLGKLCDVMDGVAAVMPGPDYTDAQCAQMREDQVRGK